MENRATYIVATIMLIFMFGLSFFAMLGDSQTMDEASHLPAGYSYITQKDMRINPEHPPLIKDLAGLSVWVWSKISETKINFPSEIPAWKKDINGQWDFGFNFMYKSGNNADKILFYGRLPMLLILLLLGFYIFKWSKESFGNNGALLALFLYSFSPTFIAHGHLVTTDVAASAAIFISLYYFIRWLKVPVPKNLIVAGIIFGLALAAKFSTFLLIPLFIFLIVIYALINIKSIDKNSSALKNENYGPYEVKQENSLISKNNSFLKNVCNYAFGLILIGLIGLIVLYPIYLFHTWNYPIERQVNDMRFVLNSYAEGPDQIPLESCKNISRISRCPAELTIWMAQKPILRPWAQYFYGFLMVIQRTTGGNTTYFMGEISNAGWRSYFPIIYAVKEPLAMHILTLIALLSGTFAILKSGIKNIFFRLSSWLKKNISEFAMISFIFLYWVTSINSPLNIGVRHVLPTFPLIYFLTARQINKWLAITAPENLKGFVEKLKFFSKTLANYSAKYAIVALLLFWQIASVVSIAPYFLTYFNELAGGATNGYKFAADSNLDWGQDFKRLVNWANKNKIDVLYVDYFGGTVGEYYLGNRLIPWSGEKNPNLLPPNSYLAISATFRQGCFGMPVAGFDYPSCYQWLKNYQPITFIGNSIFIYYIP